MDLNRELRQKAVLSSCSSEPNYSHIFQTLPEAIFVFSPENMRVVETNPAATRLYGYSREEFLFLNPRHLLHLPVDQAEGFFTGMKKGHSAFVEGKGKNKRGATFDVEVQTCPLEIGTQCGALWVVRNTTEQKKNEAELRTSRELLRALSKHSIRIQEEERNRIAQQVHDDLGQLLTVLKIDVSRLQQKIPNPSLLSSFQNMSRLLDQAIITARQITSNLRPLILDDCGLSAAIEWQLKEFQARTGIQYTHQLLPDDFELDKEIQISLFRVFQEALTNIAKHSDASEIHVRLKHQKEQLHFEIEDNGQGITKTQIESGSSLGLVGMRERVRMLMGTLTLSGTSGKGTLIKVTAPL